MQVGGGDGPATVAHDALRADQTLLQFVDRIATAAEPDETHRALINLASRFGFRHLYVTNVAKARRGEAEGLIFSSEDLPQLSLQRLANHPVAKAAWSAHAPATLAEISRAKAPESKLPLPLRGRDALSVNIAGEEQEPINFVFAGERCDTSGFVRSLLYVAAGIACESRDRRPTSRGTLTQREFDVMQLLAEGKDDDEVAHQVGISRRTVRFHVANAKRKLGVVSRAQAIVKVLRARAARLKE